jgi:hypothetical protein
MRWGTRKVNIKESLFMCRLNHFSFCFLCALAPLPEIFCVIGLSVICVRSLQAENWDRFRGPNGAGQSDAAGIPSEWTESNFLWKRPLPGVGHSSPVVWDQHVFVTTGDPQTGEKFVLAFEALSGKPLWTRRQRPR